MTEPGKPGNLHVVSTPIGNLGDISFRAVEVLSSAALVVAEDTRHSRKLLDRYEVSTPVSAYHEHNEARETPRLVARLVAGESIALVTDAGTPLLSDPGARLVAAAIAAGVPVVPVPGASALLASLVASGLAADEFTYFGFLPRKGKERAQRISEIVRLQHTSVIYESPLRTGATLNDLAAAGAGNRKGVVARELTKKFEEFSRGTIAELAERFANSPARGEVVILVGGAVPQKMDEADLRAEAHRMREAGASPREIVERLTAEFGAGKNLAYRLAHEE